MPLVTTKKQIDELYAKLIREKCYGDDAERSHKEADKLLLSALRNLECFKTVKAFEGVKKYYA